MHRHTQAFSIENRRYTYRQQHTDSEEGKGRTQKVQAKDGRQRVAVRGKRNANKNRERRNAKQGKMRTEKAWYACGGRQQAWYRAHKIYVQWAGRRGMWGGGGVLQVSMHHMFTKFTDLHPVNKPHVEVCHVGGREDGRIRKGMVETGRNREG